MDLTTLGSVKSWMSIGNSTASDSKLQSLITAISAEFMRAIHREDFAPSTPYVEFREGDGANRMLLRHWPINEVVALTVAGQTVPPASVGTAGWYIDTNLDTDRRWELYLTSGVFTDGAQVTVSYTAGYDTPPADVAQAITEWVADRYWGRSAAGVSQQSGDSNKTSFDKPSIPLSVQEVIARYKREWPSYDRKSEEPKPVRIVTA